MAKLWVFGDSFSDSHKWVINSYLTGDRNVSDPPQYKYLIAKYLKENKIPKHFEDVLGEHFGLEVGIKYNCAGGGFSNADIIESIGNNIHRIKEDDYVVIGWTDLRRIRLLNSDSQWTHIHPAGIENMGGFDDMTQSFINAIRRIMTLRYESDKGEAWRPKTKLDTEIKSFVNLINKALPKNTIHWTPFNAWIRKRDQSMFWIPYWQTTTDIRKETNGEIDDGHFSETGHIDIGKQMIEWFKNPKLIYPYQQKI